MTEIPQKHDFLTWNIQDFARKVKEFVWKYYITWLSDLANKLYDVEKLLDFTFYHMLLKIVLFFEEIL